MNEDQTSATEMHDVVEMLLSRIKDYPEDFVKITPTTGTKWTEALSIAKSVMRPEEKAAIESALEEAKRAVYMGAALKTMLSDDEPVEEKQQTFKTALGLSAMPASITSQTSALDVQLEMIKMRQAEAQARQQFGLMNANTIYSNGSALG